MIRDRAIVWPIAGLCFVITAIVLAIYILIPVASFIKVWGMDYSLTLDHYRYALDVG